jgi:hypothetical protein
MKKTFVQKLLIPVALLVFLSCKVTWVPEYNAQLEDQIANAAKANDKLYLDMLDQPLASRTYANYAAKYNEIEAEINSIQLKNEARKNNGDFLVINKNLREEFAKYRKEHKDDGTLTDGKIKVFRLQIAGFWRPLYMAERGLKIAQ